MTMKAEEKQERRRRFMDAAMPHWDAVCAQARFLTRNPADAEDAVQECFVRALRHFDSYRGPSMKAWLFAILRNLCFTEFARHRRYVTLADFPESEDAATGLMWQAPQSTPETLLERHQQDTAIQRLVGALPAPLREALVLREFDELSYKEIAEVIGIPVGTVMSRLARARTMLRAALKAADAAVWKTTDHGHASNRRHSDVSAMDGP
jgi:RNA polymerase sigma-70 factor (ECF subfamily)